MANVAKSYADTLEWDRPSGEHYKLPNAGIMKMWTTYRDSLSSVTIDMQGWQKMYSVDKKRDGLPPGTKKLTLINQVKSIQDTTTI